MSKFMRIPQQNFINGEPEGAKKFWLVSFWTFNTFINRTIFHYAIPVKGLFNSFIDGGPASQWTDFCMIGTSVMKELNTNPITFWSIPLFPSKSAEKC